MTTNSTYRIDWAHGTSERHETYEDALAAVRSVLTDPAIGHAGDLEEDGETTLVWADETSAADDDGSRAAARIVRMVEVAS